MQTMLPQIKQRIFLLGFIAAIHFGQAAAMDGSQTWAISVGRKPSIAFEGKKQKLTQGLMSRIRQSDEASFLPHVFDHGSKIRARWLVLRSPSRIRGDAGYCGSGHEDRLLLVKVSGSVASGSSEFVAQSCINSVSMDVDEFSELLSAFNQDIQSGDLRFKQTRSSNADAFRQEVTIQVIGGRAKISTKRESD